MVRGGIRVITRVVGGLGCMWRVLVILACVSGTPLSLPQGHGDSYVPRGGVRGAVRGGVMGGVRGITRVVGEVWGMWRALVILVLLCVCVFPMPHCLILRDMAIDTYLGAWLGG